jgi:drug/metabolite transporter (DMT)-like permease
MTLLSGPALAIASAVLFGISTPCAKLLLGGGVSPLVLAGLLYLGSGLGLGLMSWFRRAGSTPVEAPLRRQDMPRVALSTAFGGIIAPSLLMLGLLTTSGSSASLLLNLESVATMAIAWLAFRENVDTRLLIGAAAILCGGLVLSWHGGPAGFGGGSLAIIGACVAWGIDNNLTRKLSAADPVQISLIKGVCAGVVNLCLGLAAGGVLPDPARIGAASLIGFLGYGVSLALFVLALRHLGAARTGTYFATAPFVGAALAIPLLGEPVSTQLVIAGGLMAIGLYLHLSESHDHSHVHAPLRHEHRHRHDLHHDHPHDPEPEPGALHSHWHEHQPTTHSHPHYPDLHHRHPHAHG